MKKIFAKRMERFMRSDISDILAVAVNPEIISFAGGLPAAETFPINELKQAAIEVLDKQGNPALQYSTTEGFPQLREKIARRINARRKSAFAAQNIGITTGSQQALDILGRMFLDEGDVVLCESPTFLGALSSFNASLPRYVAVETDEQGIVPQALKEVLAQEKRAKLLYIIPDFQNPTGKTWPLSRRKEVLEVLKGHDLLVIEDNPYGELRYEGEAVPSMQSLDTQKKVITLGSFSKIVAPGMRVAWVATEDTELLKYFTFVKQGVDTHTSSFHQLQLNHYLEHCDLDANVQKNIALYKDRRDLMLQQMQEHFPKQARYNRPEGGLFIWVELPEGANTREIFKECVANNVAFVPGAPFYPNGGGENTFRLNFSNMPPEKIREGIRRLGEVLHRVLS